MFEVTVSVTCRPTAATSAVISPVLPAASHQSSVLMIPPPPAASALHCRYEAFEFSKVEILFVLTRQSRPESRNLTQHT